MLKINRENSNRLYIDFLNEKTNKSCHFSQCSQEARETFDCNTWQVANTRVRDEKSHQIEEQPSPQPPSGFHFDLPSRKLTFGQIRSEIGQRRHWTADVRFVSRLESTHSMCVPGIGIWIRMRTSMRIYICSSGVQIFDIFTFIFALNPDYNSITNSDFHSNLNRNSDNCAHGVRGRPNWPKLIWVDGESESVSDSGAGKCSVCSTHHHHHHSRQFSHSTRIGKAPMYTHFVE